MKTLFIRNLSFETSEADLRKAFEVFGKISRCYIPKNRETGESRSFGFIDMDDASVEKAIAEMNGKTLGGRTIAVSESDARPGAAGGGAPGAGARPGAPGGSRMGSGPPRTGATSGPGSGRPPGSGPSTGSRPGGAPSGPMNRFAGPPRSRTAGPPRGSMTDNRNFGPNAAPAAERFKAYHDRPKDRLKPYKREHFDFRDSLTEEEEKKAKKEREDADGPEQV
ncbi:MAG: hypothetical protein HY286_12900 [Planctomycetes bacterium]|nr:hypothetical protein [Planctomycetota bacterium]